MEKNNHIKVSNSFIDVIVWNETTERNDGIRQAIKLLEEQLN